MIRLLRMFFGSKGANPWMVLLCLTAASLAQGLGFASMVPLISLVGASQTQESSLASRIVIDVLGDLGLSPSLEVLLLPCWRWSTSPARSRTSPTACAPG